MEELISKHDALILVRNTCRDVMLECTNHYDDEICDDVYDDMSAVEAVLKCNKRIWKALNELPQVISGGDEDTISRQSAIDIVTPYDTKRVMRDALEDLPSQSEDGTAKWITGDKWKRWSIVPTSYCCSNCGWAWADKDQLGFFTFCPSCKKKMEKDIT